ncbi:MAG TPA: Smr/MutS family protein [Clostridia bacterium]|jgi:DNA-nicking Smr family endonuclease|nr:Smr/MutS family protein [Clostridia bacterium]
MYDQKFAGIVQVDVHGMTKHKAKVYIDSKLRQAKGDVYRIRVVHGYRGGTELREMIRKEYQKHPKVKRVAWGLNPGVTELILRELY